VVGEQPTAHVATISIDLELLDVIRPGTEVEDDAWATQFARQRHGRQDTSLSLQIHARRLLVGTLILTGSASSLAGLPA
jgi:hypothetical protein